MKSPRTLALLLSLLPLTAGAAPKETLELIFATQQFQNVAIAPDGVRVAWVESRPNADRAPTTNAAIYVGDVRDGRPWRVTAGGAGALADEHGPCWSPDGRQLAFLSDAAGKGQQQLYVIPAKGGVARRLTTLTGYVAGVKWSPDGRTLSLLNIAESRAHETGPVQEQVSEARLILVDVSTGEARAVSPVDSYVYEYDWAPDSRRIAAVMAKGNGDSNWWVATLRVIDVHDGGVSELFRPRTQIAVPRWSPDGSQIALIQGLMSDAGSTGGDIWLVPVAGGAARDLTPDRHGSPSWLRWQASGRLLFSESSDGGVGIGQIDTATGGATLLWHGDESVGCGVDAEMQSLSFARDGVTCAVVRSSLATPPEVWVGPVGTWAQFTHANRDIRPRWGRTEKIEWTSDGFDVQGWLVYPRNFDPAKRYPLVLSIHGGPASQVVPAWPGSWPGLAAPLAAEGYFVFIANPRGSYGQGEAFAAANVRDFGYGDFRDIMSGLDQVLKSAPIDPNRIGVSGWSYGGYMAMWTVTRTNRFRAAVAGAGIANLQSYYGQNMIDEWLIPYFRCSVYDDPAIYARSSPITFIKNVRTPTLVVVGDSDEECPSPQSYEFWHALRALGVETQLVVYENEGHHFRNLAHVQDLITRSLDWFDAHLR